MPPSSLLPQLLAHLPDSDRDLHEPRGADRYEADLLEDTPRERGTSREREEHRLHRERRHSGREAAAHSPPQHPHQHPRLPAGLHAVDPDHEHEQLAGHGRKRGLMGMRDGDRGAHRGMRAGGSAEDARAWREGVEALELLLPPSPPGEEEDGAGGTFPLHEGKGGGRGQRAGGAAKVHGRAGRGQVNAFIHGRVR